MCQEFTRRCKETAWKWKRIKTRLVIVMSILRVLTYVVSYELYWNWIGVVRFQCISRGLIRQRVCHLTLSPLLFFFWPCWWGKVCVLQCVFSRAVVHVQACLNGGGVCETCGTAPPRATGMYVRACICLFTHYIHTYTSLSHTQAHTHTHTHTHITVDQLRNGLVVGLSLPPPPSLTHDAQWPDNDCHQIRSAHRVSPPAISETSQKISYFNCWFCQFICLKLSLLTRGLLKLCLETECICYNPNAPEGYNTQSKATGDWQGQGCYPDLHQTSITPLMF